MVISHVGTLIWIMSIFIIWKAQSTIQSIGSALFLLFFFFCTPLIYLSNDLHGETFIVFFICLFTLRTRLVFLQTQPSLFYSFNLVIKIYFLPLVIFLFYSLDTEKRNFFFLISDITPISCLNIPNSSNSF